MDTTPEVARAIITQDSNPNDDPPAYPPPFFLRKGAKHLFDSNNVYSTM
jgi:hypothetical protein